MENKFKSSIPTTILYIKGWYKGFEKKSRLENMQYFISKDGYIRKNNAFEILLVEFNRFNEFLHDNNLNGYMDAYRFLCDVERNMKLFDLDYTNAVVMTICFSFKFYMDKENTVFPKPIYNRQLRHNGFHIGQYEVSEKASYAYSNAIIDK